MKKSITALQEQIEVLEHRIASIQAKCKHANVKKTHHGDTGNYDPSQDCYWTACECPDCGLRWTVGKTYE